jgi:hypothetical protein
MAASIPSRHFAPAAADEISDFTPDFQARFDIAPEMDTRPQFRSHFR